MYHGRVVESGSAAEVFRSPAHPYTEALVSCLADLFRRRDRDPLHAIPGPTPSGLREFPGCAFSERCAKADAGCSARLPPPAVVADGHWAACFKPAPPPITDE
jgi:oligopeptide/dipeptide ABC transporter ATP-binding protein